VFTKTYTFDFSTRCVSYWPRLTVSKILRVNPHE
jgi:hypothetical protein